MSTFYYPNNEVLPRWHSPEQGRDWKYPLMGLVALLLVGLVWWMRPHVSSDAERRAKAATVFIVVTGHDSHGKLVGGEGSGVIISPKGYILTNRHVVTCGEKSIQSDITVYTHSGTQDEKKFSQVSIADKSKEPWLHDATEKIRNDWCVLQIAQKDDFDYLPFNEKRNFKEKEEVSAYGFPAGSLTRSSDHGPEVKVSVGHITRLGTGNGGGTVYLSHDTLIDHGSSGGALVQDGKLIGINTAGSDTYKGECLSIPAFLLKESVFSKYGNLGPLGK